MGVLLSAMKYHDTLSHYITDDPYLSPLTQRTGVCNNAFTFCMLKIEIIQLLFVGGIPVLLKSQCNVESIFFKNYVKTLIIFEL